MTNSFQYHPRRVVLHLQFSTGPSNLFKFPKIVSRLPSLGGIYMYIHICIYIFTLHIYRLWGIKIRKSKTMRLWRSWLQADGHCCVVKGLKLNFLANLFLWKRKKSEKQHKESHDTWEKKAVQEFKKKVITLKNKKKEYIGVYIASSFA